MSESPIIEELEPSPFYKEIKEIKNIKKSMNLSFST